ncbi:MAG: hypothetical protein ACP5LJ_07655 [Candidatus Bipolaricaulaceae bacterium]
MNGERLTASVYFRREGLPRFFLSFFLALMATLLNSNSLLNLVMGLTPTSVVSLYIGFIVCFSVLFAVARCLEKKYSWSFLRKFLGKPTIKLFFQDSVNALFYLLGALIGFFWVIKNSSLLVPWIIATLSVMVILLLAMLSLEAGSN